MQSDLAAGPVPTVVSRRSRAAAAFTRYGLGAVSGHIPTNRWGIALTRRLIALIMGGLGSTPEGTRVTPVSDGAVRGDWVLGPGVEFGRRAVYYLHGSGYVICSARTHRSLAARLSTFTGLPVFVIDYRLAPEDLFPAAADDAQNGLQWLLDQGYAAEDVVVAGDSAGGHLASDLVLQRAERGEAQPAAVVLFSPLIDLTFTLAEQQERRRRDPMISAAGARRLVGVYTRGVAADHPRLTLDFRSAASLPPFLIQVGSVEMLSADARYLDETLRANGGSSVLEVWPGLVHVFQALPRLAPEADAALLRVRDFIRTVDAAQVASGAGGNPTTTEEPEAP